MTEFTKLHAIRIPKAEVCGDNNSFQYPNTPPVLRRKMS